LKKEWPEIRREAIKARAVAAVESTIPESPRLPPIRFFDN